MSWLVDLAATGGALAKGQLAPAESESKPPSAWTFDPELLGWSYSGDTPSSAHPGTIGLDYATLMSMSRTPLIGAILQTRINQVAEFTVPQSDPYSVGYKVRLRDLKGKMTRAAEKRARELGAILDRAGGKYQPGGFEGFTRRLLRDSLVYDQGNFEVIADKAGRPWGMLAVDAQTIRRARPKAGAFKRGNLRPDELRFVQVLNNEIKGEYKSEEMAWCIRRPRTWVATNGYGFPELEELLRVVTHLLNAETYNAVNFTTGIHSSVILTLKSAMPPTMFRAFKRQTLAMMSGVRNSKRTPIIKLDPNTKEELKAVNLGQSNREMEYKEWINWLLKVACSVYAMDPAEIGFVYGNEGQTGALAQHGPGERLHASKERGLRPLLRQYQSWLNEYIIHPLDEDFTLDFAGFNSLSEKDRQELDIAALKAFRTVDETRALHDLKPLGPPLGDMILDSTFFQAWSMQQGEEEGGGEGGFGGGGGEGGEGGGGGEGGEGGGEEDDGLPPEIAALGGGEEEETFKGFTERLAGELTEGLASGRLQLPKGYRKGRRWVPKLAGPGLRSFVIEAD